MALLEQFKCAMSCASLPGCEALGLSELGQVESELAAEAIRNAHWEGTQAWTEGKWTVLNKQHFGHDWSYEYESRGGETVVKDMEAWEETLRGLLKDVPPENFYWNLKLTVPEEGFEIVEGDLIEVPFRISPICTMPAGALVRHNGRSYKVDDETEVVLPTELIIALVHQKTFSWVSARRERIEARRGDGKMNNTAGEALPVGILIACGIEVNESGPSGSDFFGGL